MPNPLYIRRVITSTRNVDSLLTNPAANHFYYNKLVAANGGIEDFHTYYNISLNTFKTAINNIFNNFDSYGLTSKIKRWTPRIGSIGATQRLNAITSAVLYDGTFSGGVSFSTDGASYDGIDGVESSNFPQNAYNNYNDCGTTFKMFSSNFEASDGVIGVVEGGVYTMIQTHFSTDKFWTFWSAPDWVDFTLYSNGYWTYTQTGTALSTYKDGVLVQTSVNNSSMPLTSATMVIGARKVDGVNVQYSEVGLCHEIMHSGLTSQEVADLYSVLNTFDLALGR
jgi:hypothetical protein